MFDGLPEADPGPECAERKPGGGAGTGSIRPALWLVGIAMLLSAAGALPLSRRRTPVTTTTGRRDAVLD